jgi:hypothetical protein
VQNGRLIYATGTNVDVKHLGKGKFILDADRLQPPFYQFSYVNVIDCQNWHHINLTDALHSHSGEILGHTAPCRAEDLLSFEEAERAVFELMSAAGFDTSSGP